MKITNLCCLLLVLACPQLGNADTACNNEIGEEKARLLVHQCLKVSPATHPPCNVSNACRMMQEEINRGCDFLADDPAAPGFCQSKPVIPETFKATVISGGGTDDLTLTVRTKTGKQIFAYCDGQCGDWFESPEDGTVTTLKTAIKNKNVLITVANEPNNSRIAGPDKDERLTFIKKVKFIK